jgi:hypothetical protein
MHKPLFFQTIELKFSIRHHIIIILYAINCKGKQINRLQITDHLPNLTEPILTVTDNYRLKILY